MSSAEAAGLEEAGDDRRQVDDSRSLGHQRLDEGLGDALAPVVRVDPEGAELEAIRVLFERDEPDRPASVKGHPEHVGLKPGIIQAESSGERDRVGDVLGEGFPDPHFGHYNTLPVPP